MRYWFARWMMGAVFAALALVCVLTSARTAEALRPRLCTWLQNQWQLTTTIDALELIAVPPGIVLRGIHVVDTGEPENSPPRLTASVQRLRIRPALLSSLLWGITLDDVVVEGVQAQVDAAYLPSFAADEPKDSPKTTLQLPLDVMAASLSDIDMTYRDGSTTLAIVGAQGSLVPAGWRKRNLAIAIEHAEVRAPKNDTRQILPVHLRGQAIILGGIHRPQSVALHTLVADAPGLEVGITGALDLTGAAQIAQVRATLEGTLGEWGYLHPQLAGLQGAVHGVISVRDPLTQPLGDITLRIYDLTSAKLPAVGDLVLEGTLSRRSLIIERLAWNQAAAQRAVASGRVDLIAPYDFDLSMQLNGAPVEDVLALLTGVPSPWQAPLHGEWMAAGVLRPKLEVHGTVDVEAQPLTLKAQEATLAPILAIPSLRAKGEFRSDAKATVVHNFELWAQHNVLMLDGQILTHPAGSVHGPPQWAMRMWAGGFSLDALGPVAGLTYHGLAGVGGTLSGALMRPKVHGHAQVQKLALGFVLLGDSEATLQFDAPVLRLNALTIAHAGGTLSGEGAIHFAPAPVRFQTQLTAEHVSVSELLTTCGLPAAVANTMDGRLYGPLALQGPVLHPEGHATLAMPDFTVGPSTLGPAQLGLQFSSGATRVMATLTTQPTAGRLVGHFGLGTDGRIHADLTGRGLPLALVPTLAQSGATGKVDLQLNLEGAPKTPRGGLVVDVDNLMIHGQPQGGIHGIARTQDGTLSLGLSMLRGGLHAEGLIHLAAGLPGRVSGQFDTLDVAAFLPVASASSTGTPDPLKATASGTWQLHGPFAEPSQLALDGKLNALQLAWRGLAVHLVEPSTIHIQNASMQVSTVALTGPILQLSLAGTLPLVAHGKDMALTLAAKGDLMVLRTFFNNVDTGHGPLTAHMTVSGTPAAPRMLGEVTVHHGSLRFAGQEKTLDHLEARALFTGRTVALTLGKATLGDGKLSLTGEANVGHGTWQDPEGIINLRLKLQGVPLHPAADVETLVSGYLELAGPLAQTELHGDITLDALRYTARIDLDKLVPKRAAPPLRAPISPFGRAVRLGVHLRAPGNLLISSSVLEAELACDLLLTGTTERVGVVGSMTPLWARARWHDNLFVLTRSSIDFVDEYRIAPQFNVLAHTQACQMDADVQIQGSVDGFTVTPTGRDERGMVDPQDVLTCLQFGLRLRDFNGNQRTGATAGALSSGLDALWTVSGLDAKVRKILPIAVDELRLTSSWSSNAQRTTPRILVAKELGHHVALRYSRSIDEYNDQAFSLDYRMVDHVSISAGWLTARDVAVGDFGLDLRLHWELR